MRKIREVSILDVTIRDGSYAINYQYTPEQVKQIVSALDRAGIDYIEVSHGCGLGAGENLGFAAKASDNDYVRAAKNVAKRAKIGVIAGPKPITLEKNIDSVLDEVDFIRFFAPLGNHLAPGSNIKYAKSHRPKLLTFFQLTNSSRGSKQTILKAARQIEAFGVDIIYIVDTAGHFMPDVVGEIISHLNSKLKTKVGFHGHNNLGLAVANTLVAIKAGAVSVDASLKGMGRGAGNAGLEALVALLKRLGLARRVDFDCLLDAGERFIAPIMPAQHGVGAIDLVSADANVALYPLEPFEHLAKKAGVALFDLIRALGNDKKLVEIGVEEIRRALKKLGKDSEFIISS